MAEGQSRRDSKRGVKQTKTRSAEPTGAGKGTMVPMATACEEADGFQISSITMCGGEEATTWPYPTIVALLTAKRGSNDPKYCDVIQATAAMITATKHVINHFTDKRPTRIRLQSAIYLRVFSDSLPENTAARQP